RQQRTRNPERFEQLVVPVERLEAHELRAARVRHVRDVPAALRSAREVPREPRVDRARAKLPGLGALAGAGHVIEEPAQLGRAEIARERQAGLRAEAIYAALRGEPRDVLVDARVLPDDRIRERLAGRRVPKHDRLALVRDADGVYVPRLRAGPLERGCDHRLHVPPDLQRIVLDPTGSRADLRVLALRDGDDAARAVEQDETGAGRPLIDGTDVRSHEPTDNRMTKNAV